MSPFSGTAVIPRDYSQGPISDIKPDGSGGQNPSVHLDQTADAAHPMGSDAVPGLIMLLRSMNSRIIGASGEGSHDGDTGRSANQDR
jgi:hypothetical protein